MGYCYLVSQIVNHLSPLVMSLSYSIRCQVLGCEFLFSVINKCEGRGIAVPTLSNATKEQSAMYLDNKYTIAYNNIVSRAKARVLDGYSEKHHIIPKCLGGKDTKENLVKLTAREHFICHRLLVKMVEGKAKFQMIKAVDMMTKKTKCQDRYQITARLFEQLKKEASLAMSVLTKGIKKHSDETKQRMSGSAKGKISTFKGKKHPESAKRILAEHRSKPCISPNGERFASTKEAGIAYSISGVAIRGNIQRGKSGWRYESDEDQAIVESNRKLKLPKTYSPQTPEHIQKRVDARNKAGHYKDREATIERMSIAAKLKHSK